MAFLRVRESIIGPTCRRCELGRENTIAVIVINFVYLEMPLDAVHRVAKIRVCDVIWDVTDHEWSVPMTQLSYMSVYSSRGGETDGGGGPGLGHPVGEVTIPVVVAGDGGMVVIPVTDVTVKTELGEPEKGSADQSDRGGSGGLFGPGSGCCSGAESSCSI